MIITISGAAGSGKSSVAKRLAAKLDWPRHYIGGMRREAAEKRGMTLAEYNMLGETDPSTDLEVDRFQEELGKKEDNFIMEGRTSWYFIPQSIKIYLDVDIKTGAERVFRDYLEKNGRNEDVGLNSVEDTIESLKRRRESDDKRYFQYFNIDVYDKSHYDYILDTTDLSKDEVLDKVWEYLQTRLK